MSDRGTTTASQDAQKGDRAAVEAFLSRHAPFDQMDPDHVAFLASHARTESHTRDSIITQPDHGPAPCLFIIMSGLIYRELPGQTDSATVDTQDLGPGESFPIAALLSRRAVRTVHRAAEDTVCLELPWADFNHLLEMSTVFNDFCTQRFATLLGRMQQVVQADALSQQGDDTSLNTTLGSRLRDEPISCLRRTPIRDALEAMQQAHIGSIVITDDGMRPAGMFTLKDLLNRVALAGVGLDAPVEQVMTPDVISLPETAFAFEAAMLMADNGIHHICVVKKGRLVGVISERDLFSMQRVGLVNLSKAITRAESVACLARMGEDIHQLVEQMIAQGVKVSQITQIITLLNDHIARRIIDLCLARAREEAGTERGRTTDLAWVLDNVSFSWLAFGSEGRQEQTLKTDQDNGILFEQPTEGLPADAIRKALLPLARQINEALDQCGYPLCTGNIMASNPECCLSQEEWRQRFKRWIDQGTPEHLLKASIFFDFRVIYGPTGATEALRQWLLRHSEKNPRFRKQMAANALGNRPPLGLIRDFKLSSGGEHPNTLNLKFNGVAPFVDAARIIALSAGVGATNTNERLRGAAEAGKLDSSDVAAWNNAYNYIQMLRMRKNQEQRIAGEPLSNHVSPDGLNGLDRRILKEAFREARKLQTKLSVEYQL